MRMSKFFTALDQYTNMVLSAALLLSYQSYREKCIKLKSNNSWSDNECVPSDKRSQKRKQKLIFSANENKGKE